MRTGIFITGTDTDVGKTWVGRQIAAALYQKKIPLVIRKPAESGCELSEGNLVPVDATQYWQAVQQSQSLDDICPYRFEAPLAPVQAARLQGIRISAQQLVAACAVEVDEFLLVEGAGGFYSPMTEDGLNSDLAVHLNLPVLLVAKDTLGCLNHILLSLAAIHTSGLSCPAILLNRHPSSTTTTNADMLAELVSTPILEASSDTWLGQCVDLLQT